MKKVGYGLLAIILIVMVWKFDFDGLITSVRRVKPLAFLGLLSIQLISQLLVNYQWCRIGKIMGKDHNFFKMLYINSMGTIMDGITPGVKVGGEVTRAIALKNILNYSANESATLVTIQKMISFSSFFLVNLFAFAHISAKLEIFNGIVLKIAIYFFLIGLMSILVSFFLFTSKMEKRISNVKPIRDWIRVLQRYMLTVLSNIEILKGIKGELYRQFFLSLTIWLLFPLKMILLVSLFTINYEPIFLIEVTFISYMVGMIPLLPGGLGSFEATMTSLLMVMKMQSEEALAITLIFRFITFWFVVASSFLYIIIWKVGERDGPN